MIDEIVYSYMSDALDVPVYMEVPKQLESDKYVVIERVGMRKSNHVETVSFAFQSYATERMLDAALLDEQVRAAAEAMIEFPVIGSVRLESNYNHTDTRTKWYRYQCIYGVTYVEGSV